MVSWGIILGTTKKYVKDYNEKEMKDFSSKSKKWMIRTANEWAIAMSMIDRSWAIEYSLPQLKLWPTSLLKKFSQNKLVVLDKILTRTISPF
jgi:hypothetical protein